MGLGWHPVYEMENKTTNQLSIIIQQKKGDGDYCGSHITPSLCSCTAQNIAKLHCQHAISARRTTRNPPTNSSAGYITRAQVLQEELRNLESSWFCRLIGGFRLKSHQIQLHTWNCSKTLNHKPAFQLSQRFEKGVFGARLGFTWRIIPQIVAKKHGEEVPEVGGFPCYRSIRGGIISSDSRADPSNFSTFSTHLPCHLFPLLLFFLDCRPHACESQRRYHPRTKENPNVFFFRLSEMTQITQFSN